ncbi:hypothetical protein ACQEVZ_02530 [Dactylosporangium sp. CA-152071]|uniref:hypothetical protein n=1 Tax=Dactylosporangium sp. CA-152071 TaxID=3239933 RepID=UPI003D89B4DF
MPVQVTFDDPDPARSGGELFKLGQRDVSPLCVAVAVLVGVFALMVPGNVELRQDPLLGYPDFRAAAAAFAGARSTDGLVIAGDNDAILHPHMPAYYLRPRGIELRGAFLAQDPAGGRQLRRRAAPTCAAACCASTGSG